MKYHSTISSTDNLLLMMIQQNHDGGNDMRGIGMDNDDKESIISANTMIRKSYNDKLMKEKERMLSLLKNEFVMKNDDEIMNLENDIHQLIDRMIKEEYVISEGHHHHNQQQKPSSSLSSLSSSSSYSSLSSSNKSVTNNNNNHHHHYHYGHTTSSISNNSNNNNNKNNRANGNSRSYNAMNTNSTYPYNGNSNSLGESDMHSSTAWLNQHQPSTVSPNAHSLKAFKQMVPVHEHRYLAPLSSSYTSTLSKSDAERNQSMNHVRGISLSSNASSSSSASKASSTNAMRNYVGYQPSLWVEKPRRRLSFDGADMQSDVNPNARISTATTTTKTITNRVKSKHHGIREGEENDDEDGLMKFADFWANDKRSDQFVLHRDIDNIYQYRYKRRENGDEQKKKYNNLPEVQAKLEQQRKKEEAQARRDRAREYELERRKSWNLKKQTPNGL